ncbi:hypothetical protein [Pelagibius sp.]|uniref:hypothetical protein n=1 Tax=Pelagibius sp. TaxID=1931238 RepID=UPI003B512A62
MPTGEDAAKAAHDEIPLLLDLNEDSAKDSLHILPLSTVPLVTGGLREARLIKNAQFEGVVELFTDAQAGSGQVAPADLPRVFQFDDGNRGDLPLIKNLASLPSYDVYSMRVELRRLGIDVENVEDLRLSEEKVRALDPHMAAFTRPLVRAVFGREDDEQRSVKDLVGLFAAPDAGEARKNLAKLAGQLRLDITAIPKFLQDYGDVYLSLAYYQACLDASRPKLERFLKALAALKADRNLSKERGLMAACSQVETKITTTVAEVGDILTMFRDRTADMWEDMSQESFQRMERLIVDYQNKIGGALCVTTVKLGAWTDEFPRPDSGGPLRRADFLMSTMRPGLERLKAIQYHDKA